MIKSILIHNTPVEYIDRGQGEPILCLHGAMGGSDQSDILGRTIGSKGFRYIALSRPGYPGTPLSHGKTPSEQAQFLCNFLKELNIEKVVIMAISGGGYSAIHLAAKYPSMCKKLILCSTTAGDVESKIPLSFHIMNMLIRIPFISKSLQKSISKNFDKSLERSITIDHIRENFKKEKSSYTLFKEMSVGMFNRMKERLPGTYNDILQTRKIALPLSQINVPTLIIHGMKDTMVPFERHGKKLAEEIPHAEKCFIEDGEHVSIFTHRDSISESVNEFLSE